MRFLIYSINFAPDLTGIGKYSGDMAVWLKEQGHDVRVVAAPPYYPNWKVEKAYQRPGFRREIWRDIRVWRAPLWVPKFPSGAKRVLHLMSFAITSAPIMMRQAFWRPHVVLTVAPAFVCAPMGYLTAWLCGAQSWLHLQDFEVDVAFRLGLLKGRRLRRWVTAMERFLLRRFDCVSSISQRMVESLLQKGVPEERTRFFPNWVDTSRITPVSRGNAYRKQLHIASDAVVVLFSGTLGAKQGTMLIPAVAAILSRHKEVVFVICGDGVMKNELEQATAERDNVRMLPLQPAERLGELLGMADIHLLPQTPDAADLVMPSKLSGMLASGRPVVATCEPGSEIDSVVSQCGIVVRAEDSEATAEAILDLVERPARRYELGRRARVWAEDNLERHAVLSRAFGAVGRQAAIEPVPVSVVQDDQAIHTDHAA